MPDRRLVTLFLACAACGKAPARSGPAFPYNLTLAGSPNLLVHPGEKRTLQVLLSQDQTGPVAGARLHLAFEDGDPSGARVDASDVATDSTGVATFVFSAGRPTDRSEVPKLVVTAPGLDVTPVAFSFAVVPVRRLLQIVGTPFTHVAQDGLNAVTSLGLSTSAALHVRELDLDTGAPIAGDPITFTRPATSSVRSTFKDAIGNAVTATTGPGGDAQVWLSTTQAPEGFLVSASPAAGGSATAYFNVTVQAAPVRCATSQGCDPGQICVDGTCQDGGGQACKDTAACPIGWTCIAGTCQPGGNTCTDAASCIPGQCCDGLSGICRDPCADHPCAAGSHCEPGPVCGGGTCTGDGALPDVTGVWLTRHTFDIRQALPGALAGIFIGFRMLDQVLLGKLTIAGLPGWLQDVLGAFVSRLLQQYLPGWLQLFIQIGDDLSTVLSTIRAEGSMRLAKGPDLAHVRGTEAWTSLVFYWLPLCGGEIGGDPSVPPDCARIDLYTWDAEVPDESFQCRGETLPTVTALVAPFTATVGGKPGAYSLTVDRRTVKVKMGQVVLLLVNRLIGFATGGEYQCLEEATDCEGGGCLADCGGLGRDVEDLTRGFLPADATKALCEVVVTHTGQLATDALAKAWPIRAELLDFSGRASVTAGDAGTCETGQSCAVRLGRDDYEKLLRTDPAARDGAWSGSFFLDGVPEMPGAWEATRPE